MSGRIDGSRRASIDLPEPGEPDEQHVVPARGGDLKRPLDVLLPHDVGEVGTGAAVRLRRRPRRGRRDRLLAREVAHQLKDVFNRVDREPTRERRLGGVLRPGPRGTSDPAAARTAPSVARPSPGAAPP